MLEMTHVLLDTGAAESLMLRARGTPLHAKACDVSMTVLAKIAPRLLNAAYECQRLQKLDHHSDLHGERRYL